MLQKANNYVQLMVLMRHHMIKMCIYVSKKKFISKKN